MCSTRPCCRKCCPNGCCGFCKPPKQVQQQVDTLIHLKENVKETETRYGFINFYPGVRTADNSYTCPMLAVHLYRQGKFNVNIAQDNRTVTFAGRNNQQTYEGEKQFVSNYNASTEEEVIMVPLEDVMHISYKADVKKGILSDIKSHVTPVHELSENCCDRCCASIANCCRKIRDCCCCRCCQEENRVVPLVQNTLTIITADPNRNEDYVEEDLPLPRVKENCCRRCCDPCRCWCCRKKRLVRLIKKTNTKAARQAERVITMTIQYSKYSNLDSASHTRLLSNQDQLDYFKAKFQPDAELKFYLINNTEFEPMNFDVKKNEAEVLCRAVMQLKGMKNRYPSEDELNKILDQPQQRIFGTIFYESALQLPSNAEMQRVTTYQTQQ
ncbi:unnamed protein product [Adineta steineri]|uniref:Uncharacterized protein n=3 Tax=Adineta steineri TaxID=433720 RepID=A0A813VMH5_9BILA|nr:unnamed protein product [Adineta steineri]CAF4207637.1 unnamed protein product [Adineta steineri]